jgi:hypothetical protein
MARLALAAAAALALALPGHAAAQLGGPFPPQQVEEYGPGITVAGAGFAPAGERSRAASRAVGDARRRAEAIAGALGVSLGEIRAVELNTPFEPRPRCRPDQNPLRCASLEAVSADVTFAIAGSPTSDEGAREVSGTGSAIGRVDGPLENSPAIRNGLRRARLAATPDAANMARANAEAAASAAGIGLGPLFSVVEFRNPYGYEPLLGAFGPGRFCARLRRVTVRRDPETGQRRVVRGRRRLRCVRIRSVPVTLEATYLGA